MRFLMPRLSQLLLLLLLLSLDLFRLLRGLRLGFVRVGGVCDIGVWWSLRRYQVGLLTTGGAPDGGGSMGARWTRKIVRKGNSRVDGAMEGE